MPTKLQDQETGNMLPWQYWLPDIAKKAITNYHAIKPPHQI